MNKEEFMKKYGIDKLTDLVRNDGKTYSIKKEILKDLDILIQQAKEEYAKICDKNHIQIITEKSLDRLSVQAMNPVTAYNKANKDNAKAIRDKDCKPPKKRGGCDVC